MPSKHKKSISYCVKDAIGLIHQQGKVAATRRDLDGCVLRCFSLLTWSTFSVLSFCGRFQHYSSFFVQLLSSSGGTCSKGNFVLGKSLLVAE